MAKRKIWIFYEDGEYHFHEYFLGEAVPDDQHSCAYISLFTYHFLKFAFYLRWKADIILAKLDAAWYEKHGEK